MHEFLFQHKATSVRHSPSRDLWLTMALRTHYTHNGTVFDPPSTASIGTYLRIYAAHKNFLFNDHAYRDTSIHSRWNFTVNRGDGPYANAILQLYIFYQVVHMFEYCRPIKSPSSDACEHLATPCMIVPTRFKSIPSIRTLPEPSASWTFTWTLHHLSTVNLCTSPVVIF